MGDADVALHELNDMQLDDMTEALDNFRDDLTNLHALVTEMERRVAHHILQRMRGYVMFRNFLIAINLVFIPVLMALGLSYILKEAIELEPQGPLQGFIEFLWFIAAFVGAPLYFGSIWAIYKFTQPEDSFEEISESEMDEEINDYEISMLMRQMFNRDEVNNNERIEHQLGENSGNEADDEDGEFVVSLNNQEPVQNDPDLPAVIQSVTESSIENTASVTEEQDNNIENQNDNMPVVLPSQVDEVLVSESEDSVTSIAPNNS